jgi:hypothetical protein
VWVGRRAGILPAAGCSSARRPPLKKTDKETNTNTKKQAAREAAFAALLFIWMVFVCIA